MREVINSSDESVGFGSYCGLPNSDSEMFFYYSESDGYIRVENKNPNRTEIPVQHFINLIEDKIVAWRLVDDGLFKAVIDCDLYTLKNNNCDVCICIYYDGTFEVCLQDEFTEIRMNVKTYSDLLTLIRLLK